VFPTDSDFPDHILTGRFAFLLANFLLFFPYPRQLRDGKDPQYIEGHPARGATRNPARRRVHAQMNVLYFFRMTSIADVAEFGVV